MLRAAPACGGFDKLSLSGIEAMLVDSVSVLPTPLRLSLSKPGHCALELPELRA